MKTGGNLIVVGTFSRILKNDGTMLFRPYLNDSSFILDASRLIHSDFHTEWAIESAKSVSKGFHIKLKEVKNILESKFFIDENFSLPEKEIEGKSIDLLIGKSVSDLKGKVLGRVLSLSNTPSYLLLEVLLENGKTVYVPDTEDFVSIKKGVIILLKEPVL